MQGRPTFVTILIKCKTVHGINSLFFIFEILKAVTIKCTVCWDLTLYRLGQIYVSEYNRYMYTGSQEVTSQKTALSAFILLREHRATE